MATTTIWPQPDHTMLQAPPRSAPSGLAVPWHTRGSAAAPLAAAVLVVAAALVSSPVVAAVFVPAVIAATHDAATARLPDRWVAATALLGVVAAIAAYGWGSAGLIAAAALGVGGVLLAFHLVSPRAAGFGDVKFAAALGPVLVAGTTIDTFAGIASLVAVWLCAASAGAVVHAALARRGTVPLGPALVVGATLALAWGGIVR